MTIISINIRPEGTWGYMQSGSHRRRRSQEGVSIYRWRKINWITLTWAPVLPPTIKSPSDLYLPRFYYSSHHLPLFLPCYLAFSDSHTISCRIFFCLCFVCSNWLLKFDRPFLFSFFPSEITTAKITCHSTSHSATEAACILTSYFCRATAAICLALQYPEMFLKHLITADTITKNRKSNCLGLDSVIKMMSEHYKGFAPKQHWEYAPFFSCMILISF